MQDSSLDPGTDTTDDSDLAVDIDTLSIDGIRPKAGDSVDLKVKGSITKLVDNTAFVKPKTINDQPIPSTPPQVSDEQELMAGAQAYDASKPGY